MLFRDPSITNNIVQQCASFYFSKEAYPAIYVHRMKGANSYVGYIGYKQVQPTAYVQGIQLVNKTASSPHSSC